MKIIATGSYLPKNFMTNHQLSKIIDTSDEWITSRTGIKKRHLVKDESTTDLALNSVKIALGKSHVCVNDVELVVVATSTADNFIPGVSHQLLKRLGIKKAMAFDINAACSGFVYAMDLTKALMKMHGYKFAVVVGAEVMSKIIDWNDRNTCVLFGDGAGAVIIENDPGDDKILYSRCECIKDEKDSLLSGGIGVRNPFNDDAKDDYFLSMKGQDVFKFAVTSTYNSLKEAIAELKLKVNEVDYYVMHQANSRIIDYVAKKIGVPVEKFHSTIAETGNTSAASIPIVLDKMNSQGLLKPDMVIALTGFGAGLTYGTMIIKWS